MWHRLLLCFELHGPLRIGFLPGRAGTVLAPTRYYVPGRSVWGAVTASITTRLYEQPSAKHFAAIGNDLRQCTVASYFYLFDGTLLYVPDYGDDAILRWGGLPEAGFRARAVGSRVSTAVAAGGGAAEATLHEMEFVRHRVGSFGAKPAKVFVAGAIWLANDARVGECHVEVRDESAWLDGHDLFEDLILGGDSNYGFGRCLRTAVSEACRDRLREMWPDDPGAERHVDQDRGIPAHARFRGDVGFYGDVEILAGREYPPDTSEAFARPGRRVVTEGYFFAPGTRLVGAERRRLRMDGWGRFEWVDKVDPASAGG